MRAKPATLSLAILPHAAAQRFMLLAILVLLLPGPAKAAAASRDPASPAQMSAAPYADAADLDAPEPFAEAASDAAADLEAEIAHAAPGSSVHVLELGWGLLVQGEVPSAQAEARVREIAASRVGPMRLDLVVRPPKVSLRVRLVEAPATGAGEPSADADARPGAMALKLARVRAEETETVRSGGVIRIHRDDLDGVIAVRPVYEAQGRIRLEVARADRLGRVRPPEAGETARSVEMTPWSTLLIRHVAAGERPSRLGRVAGFLRRPWAIGRPRPAQTEVMLVVEPSLPEIDGEGASAAPLPDLIVADLAPANAPRRAALGSPLRRLVSQGLSPAASALRFLRRGPAARAEAHPETPGVLREAALTPSAR